MTCGACEPEGFRPKTGGRVLGYLTTSKMHTATLQARKLYFMGAEAVFSDAPDAALEDRPGWKLLSHPVCLRSGDRLILSKDEDLHSNPNVAEAHLAALLARGVEVFVLKPEFFEDQERFVCEAAEQRLALLPTA